MKKIIRLAIAIGLLVFIYITIFSHAQVSEATSITRNSAEAVTKPEQSGPPWYNESWHYRHEVIISNSGALLPYYQVLVKLDNTNFDFSRVKLDGSDIRFTHSDGTTELKFWIESWDNTDLLAYVWVRVPSLANGNTVIYLYYNNPNAVAISDGTTTFDFFDDYWCQFPGAGCKNDEGGQNRQPLNDVDKLGVGSQITNRDLMLTDPWVIISGSPVASTGTLNLPDGTGIKTTNSYQYNAVGFKVNYGLGTGKEWAGFINGASGQRTMIGDLPDHVDDLYLIDHVTEDENTLMPRVGGMDWHSAYHIYEVRWNSGQTEGDIDHGASTALSTQPAQVPNIFLPITFYSDTGSGTSLLVDWVYVRQYRDPEPMVTLGAEQGLIDMAITQEDFPDPLYAGEALTYELTISNTSNLEAPGVVLTDTLPGEVELISVDPSQGDCTPAEGVILCSLNTIPALSTASITVVVTTTMDGMISNLATVGSPGFDFNMSNNATEALTMVNPSADLRVAVQGNPEVLLPGSILTYTITVTNQGPSDVLGVTMTDTLPGEVRFIGTSPNICDVNGLEVTCPLGDLNQAEEASIVITTTVVITQTMELIDSATTSSASIHDPNLNNNTTETANLVDTTPPIVNWERPVENGDTYFTFGGMVTLDALATDNDQVDHVKFLWFDHMHNLWVTIATEYNPPYQVPFDSDVLEINELYQVFAQGYDRVGNFSWERIFIERLFPYMNYMPLIDK